MVQKEEFSVKCYMWDTVRDKPILSSERMLRKDYNRKAAVENISRRESQGAWRQDELIDSKPPVVK
jgi:hypothetical protein